MGAQKRPKLIRGKLKSGAEFCYYRKPSTLARKLKKTKTVRKPLTITSVKKARRLKAG